MCTASQCRILQMELFLRVRTFLQMGGKRGRDYRGWEGMRGEVTVQEDASDASW
jgi:hypothetical protein